MTVNKIGYNIPSTFQMIKVINNDSPRMLKVHRDEFNRISKKDGKQLSKPYMDYVQMLYVKYILNKKQIFPNIVIQAQHIGMKMLNNTALT